MKKIFVLVVGLTLFFSNVGFAVSQDEEIQQLKQQVQDLLRRIEQLEGKAPVAAAPKEGVCSVLTKKAASMIKMSGRFAAGYFDSQKAGSFSDGTWAAPDAKLRFDIQPDKINTIVMRGSFNNGKFNEVDYLYVDSVGFLPFLEDKPFTLSSRLGKFKLDYGEETWSDNPVESTLISNSIGNATGVDEGWQLFGTVGKEKKIKYSASVSNGTDSTGDNNPSKAFAGKIGVTPFDPIYLSASYYNSGDLETDKSAYKIAGLNSVGKGVTDWKRSMWEVDARIDLWKGTKPLDPPAYNDSKVFVRGAYGQFSDELTGGSDRDGDYGFVEGTWNICPKFYTSGRWSVVDLDSGTASLQGAVAEWAQRWSLGGGFRLTDAAIIKAEYSWNVEDDDHEVDNDQVATVLSMSF